APGVRDAALNRHPVQPQIVEQVVEYALAASRHDTLTLIALLDPVTHTAMPVGPIDRVDAQRTRECAVDPEAALGSPSAVELLAHPRDESPQIFRRGSEIHPR